ncbi:tetratricopeptide repeat protein [Chloroflexi bacterium TSY]|nr:tetratricopeptide repeat protein [Chloroflexi bacterium TSY]
MEPKPLALFIYLAVTRQIHARDALAAFFWPEMPKGRTQLRNNIWVIKKSLRDWADRWMDIDRNTVGLHPEADLWLDLTQFHHSLTLSQQQCETPKHPKHEACPDCLPFLTQAIELCQDQFMAGFTLNDSPAFDEWQFFQREEVTREMTAALDKLIRYHRAEADFDQAIAYARRRLQLDPLHEPVHQLLMHLYVESGQRSAAYRQYQECERILDAELNLPPQEETRQLYEAIRSHQLPEVLTEPLSTGTLSPSIKKGSVLNSSLSPEPLETFATSTAGMHSVAGKTANAQQFLYTTSIDQIDRSIGGLLEQLTPLVGRDEVCSAIQSQLSHSTGRLMTLVGPGGIGKTRLALQVAANLLDNFADGCHVVSLAAIRAGSQVLSAIAQTLGVHEQANQSRQEQIEEFLREQELLLVLDNFEQVIDAAPQIVSLVKAAPKLKVLVTSRERLRVSIEDVYPVPSLGLPSAVESQPPEALSQFESVQLFIARAQAARSDFVVDQNTAPAIAEICARLDGLPLAIELAAARVRLFSPAALLERLTQSERASLKLLRSRTRETPERHRALRNTIAWSYDLLNAAEQALFRRLSVFVGGCTLEAAEAVCSSAGDLTVTVDEEYVLDLLESLIDKSLVIHQLQEDGNPRFMMLETIREFGLESLASEGEEFAIHQQHANFFIQLSANAQIEQESPNSPQVLKRFMSDYNNVRATMRWVLAHGQIANCLHLCHTLLDFWLFGYLVEAQEYVMAVVHLAAGSMPTPNYVNTLVSAGYLAYVLGEDQKAQHFFEQGLSMSRELGGAGHVKKLTTALGLLGNIRFDRGNYDGWIQAHQESLAIARKENHEWSYAMVLSHMGTLTLRLGNYADARKWLEESLEIQQRVGQQMAISLMFCHLATFYLHTDDFDQAESFLVKSMSLASEINDRSMIALCQVRLGQLAILEAQYEKADRLLKEALIEHRYTQQARKMIEIALRFVQLAIKQRKYIRSLMLAGKVSSFHEDLEIVQPPLEQAAFERDIEIARRHLSKEEAAKAWHTGRLMNVDEMAEFILMENPPDDR